MRGPGWSCGLDLAVGIFSPGGNAVRAVVTFEDVVIYSWEGGAP